MDTKELISTCVWRFVMFNYHPQTKFAKVIFLHLSLILFTGVSASVHAGIPPPGLGTPREQSPPGADTPWEQTPPRSRTPAGAGSPRTRHHPPGAETATAADGTHPTGMHSCIDMCW